MRLIVLLPLILIVAGCDRQNQPAPQANATAPTSAVQPGAGLDRSHQGQAAPNAVFKDPDGEAVDFKEFRGRPLLVNLWASWCAPCVKELPTLDALARAHSADGSLGVIAVSQDSAPQASVAAFLGTHHIGTLGAYHDPDMKLSSAYDAQILPMSVYYDKYGRERWRFVGDLDWTGEKAKALLSEAR